jgi:hypothetical protein
LDALKNDASKHATLPAASNETDSLARCILGTLERSNFFGPRKIDHELLHELATDGHQGKRGGISANVSIQIELLLRIKMTDNKQSAG